MCRARRPIPTPVRRAGNDVSMLIPADPPTRSTRAMSGLLRLQAPVDELLAGPLGHVHPGVPLLVALGRARAGRVGRLAVILARPHEPVTLLVLELRHRRRARLGPRQDWRGERGRHRRTDQHPSRLHASCLLSWILVVLAGRPAPLKRGYLGDYSAASGSFVPRAAACPGAQGIDQRITEFLSRTAGERGPAAVFRGRPKASRRNRP